MVGDAINAKRAGRERERELRNAANMNQMLNLHEEKAAPTEAEEDEEGQPTAEEEKNQLFRRCHI